MATTALLSAAGRRLSRCSGSASTIVWHELRGQHKLTIDGCSPSEKKPWNWSVTSKAFEAAGYRWKITYYPNGAGLIHDDYISLYLGFYGYSGQTEQLDFKFTLLDQAGNPVPKHSRSKEGCIFHRDGWWWSQGFHDFIRWEDLVASGCLKDNRFAVQCDIAVIKCRAEKNEGGGDNVATPARVFVPPPDLHRHLSNLLWKKQGTDVEIRVGGEATFDAHGWLLAARSPVFDAELFAATKEKVPGGGGGGRVRRRIEIQDMEPKVFKVMLQFMYTDALPEMVEHEAVAMAQGLLAAAHRYKLERLKLMCEEMLCRRIDVSNVGSTLVVAEQHGYRALKEACLEFMVVPGNLKAVMDTGGLEKIQANCPTVLMEFAMKNLAELE